jgi:hypothetical protein
MNSTTIANNASTVNELAWTADLRLHPRSYEFRGVIDVLNQSTNVVPPRDGANMDVLVITDNVITFTNPDPRAPEPMSAFRFVPGGNEACSVSQLDFRRNRVTPAGVKSLDARMVPPRAGVSFPNFVALDVGIGTPG